MFPKFGITAMNQEVISASEASEVHNKIVEIDFGNKTLFDGDSLTANSFHENFYTCGVYIKRN